jgi:hypothetical protein
MRSLFNFLLYVVFLTVASGKPNYSVDELKTLFYSQTPKDIDNFFTEARKIDENTDASYKQEMLEFLYTNLNDTRENLLLSSDETIISVKGGVVGTMVRITGYQHEPHLPHIKTQENPFGIDANAKLAHSEEARQVFIRWFEKNYLDKKSSANSSDKKETSLSIKQVNIVRNNEPVANTKKKEISESEIKLNKKLFLKLACVFISLFLLILLFKRIKFTNL